MNELPISGLLHLHKDLWDQYKSFEFKETRTMRMVPLINCVVTWGFLFFYFDIVSFV